MSLKSNHRHVHTVNHLNDRFRCISCPIVPYRKLSVRPLWDAETSHYLIRGTRFGTAVGKACRGQDLTIPATGTLFSDIRGPTSARSNTKSICQTIEGLVAVSRRLSRRLTVSICNTPDRWKTAVKRITASFACDVYVLVPLMTRPWEKQAHLFFLQCSDANESRNNLFLW